MICIPSCKDHSYVYKLEMIMLSFYFRYIKKSVFNIKMLQVFNKKWIIGIWI